MKSTVTILALASLIAWPTAGEAVSKKKSVLHNPHSIAMQRRAHAYAYGYPNGQRYWPSYHRPHSPNPAWDVYFTDGTYAGSDPDPFIRDMLQRDDPRNVGPP